jgi:chromate transporter
MHQAGSSRTRDIARFEMSGTRTRLIEVASLFLKLGLTAFGGPAAHIALMEHEAVRRRGWLTREEFLDYLGATNLIPGPNSTELAIHIGRVRAGWWGLAVAGVAFIAPAAAFVTALAWVYVEFGALPAVADALYGIKPVMIAIVVQALGSLARGAVRSAGLFTVAVGAAAAALAGVHELVVLSVSGLVVVMARFTKRRRRAIAGALLAACTAHSGVVSGAPLAAGAAIPGLVQLFFVFLKTGAVLFGSGYVLLAFLRADLVERLRWLTEAQLLDAIAVGQITPGPVLTTATFIGYLVAGVPGAIVATVAIFLPAFLFVAISGPLVPRLRRSALAGAMLDGVNVASLALMAVVAWHLGRTSLIDLPTVLVAIVSGIALLRWRVNSALLIAGGALAGFCFR